MKGKMQIPGLQDGAYASSSVSLSGRRLAAAIALGLTVMYAPTMAFAQSASQGPNATTAQAPAHADATTAAKKKKSDDQKDITDLAGLTVTGIRASLESSQSLKQNATQIVDSVTATDINALPDRSVTETLQRISG